jgi:hypothetical protein
MEPFQVYRDISLPYAPGAAPVKHFRIQQRSARSSQIFPDLPRSAQSSPDLPISVQICPVVQHLQHSLCCVGTP